MNHFFQNIIGYSDFNRQGTLLNYICNKLNKNNLKILELGVFQGKCTAMWVVELINKNINFEYYAVDHFNGSAEHEKINYYPIALKNLEPILDKINVVNLRSDEAYKKFEDNYFDFVYIDASHDYENVKKDIYNWYSKVKLNGYIAGDDYNQSWPDVIKAVDEIFNINVLKPSSGQWAVKKENEII